MDIDELAILQMQDQFSRQREAMELRKLLSGPRRFIMRFISQRIADIHSAATGRPIPRETVWTSEKAVLQKVLADLQDAQFRNVVQHYSIFVESLIDAERERCLDAVRVELDSWNNGGEHYANVTEACSKIAETILQGGRR